MRGMAREYAAGNSRGPGVARVCGEVGSVAGWQSGGEWNGSQSGHGASELGFPKPMLGKMQGKAARRAGDPSHQSEEPPPEGFGGRDPFTQADAGCPAGQVVRHHLYRQPGAVGGEAAHAAGFRRVLILCPPHLTRKWKREVEDTVPQARAAIVTSITDLERLRLSVGPAPLFAIMSRERAKLSYRWQPAVIQRWAAAGGRLVRDEQTGEPFQVPCCPRCYAQVVDKDGVPLTNEEQSRKRRDCDLCGSALWQAYGSGPRRYPLADYVKHRMKGFFDLFIGDEVHECAPRNAA